MRLTWPRRQAPRRGAAVDVVDARWGNVAIGPYEDVVEKRCGCLLAVFSTLMIYYQGESTPGFPVSLNVPIFGQQTFFDFNPIYMHKYLYDGPFNQGAAPTGLQALQPEQLWDPPAPLGV
jgi:hypothetical protein